MHRHLADLVARSLLHGRYAKGQGAPHAYQGVPPSHQGIKSSTAQLNVGLRPILHRDGANLGRSLTISLGLFVGGGLWQAQTQRPTSLQRDIVHFAPWEWCVMDGSLLHAGLPYAGERASIVLFKHDAIMKPLPLAVVSRAAALGLVSKGVDIVAPAVQSLARSAEWSADWELHGLLV